MAKDVYSYTPLKTPVRITEHDWPAGTVPLVSTRTMTFMHENYICDCIEGILMQKTTFPVQVLIHDDASTDKTSDIVREYAEKYPRLIKAYYQPDNTYSKSRDEKNRLRKPFFDWITGKYVAICEGDDYWTDEMKLQKQVNVLQKRQECILVCHAVNYFDNQLKTIVKKQRCALSSVDLPVEKLISGGGGYIPTLSILHRRELMYDMPEFRRISPAGDYPLVLLAATMGKIHYIDDIMGTYRCNVLNSAMATIKKMDFEKQIKRWEKTALMLYSFDVYTRRKYFKEIRKESSRWLMKIFIRESKNIPFARKLKILKNLQVKFKLSDFLLICFALMPFGRTLLYLVKNAKVSGITK